MKKPKQRDAASQICYELALFIYLVIMNILWAIICLIIWPFKRKFIYDMTKTTKFLMNTHLEAQGLKPKNEHPNIPLIPGQQYWVWEEEYKGGLFVEVYKGLCEFKQIIIGERGTSYYYFSPAHPYSKYEVIFGTRWVRCHTYDGTNEPVEAKEFENTKVNLN